MRTDCSPPASHDILEEDDDDLTIATACKNPRNLAALLNYLYDWCLNHLEEIVMIVTPGAQDRSVISGDVLTSNRIFFHFRVGLCSMAGLCNALESSGYYRGTIKFSKTSIDVNSLMSA